MGRLERQVSTNGNAASKPRQHGRKKSAVVRMEDVAQLSPRTRRAAVVENMGELTCKEHETGVDPCVVPALWRFPAKS